MKTKSMKIRLLVLGVIALFLSTVSCKEKGCTDPNASNYDPSAEKDDGSCVIIDPPQDSLTHVSGSIASDVTWTPDQIYLLEGKVVVANGATLTILPGTIIKGDQGTESLASALIIARGAQINACGTVSQPIIFTSVLDDIQIGQLSGTNLQENDFGLWGGLIVLGNAPISAGDGDTESQIEGIPAVESYGAFGGTNPTDNSGSLCYISIRHGGTALSAGKEINGLTLGGVGSSTTINNIEVIANFDDGIEFFGGTVNASNLIVGFQGDDGIDVDMNYSGTISNFVVVNGGLSDEALEIDGPEGSTYTSGLFNLTDGSVWAYGGAQARGEFKSKAQGTITNVNVDTVKVRISFESDCSTLKTDAWTHLTQASPTLVFSGTEFSIVDVFTSTKDPNDDPCTGVPTAFQQSDAENAMSSTTATGADASVFNSWSWMAYHSKL